jgi:hypothetical protein
MCAYDYEPKSGLSSSFFIGTEERNLSTRAEPVGSGTTKSLDPTIFGSSDDGVFSECGPETDS